MENGCLADAFEVTFSLSELEYTQQLFRAGKHTAVMCSSNLSVQCVFGYRPVVFIFAFQTRYVCHYHYTQVSGSHL